MKLLDGPRKECPIEGTTKTITYQDLRESKNVHEEGSFTAHWGLWSRFAAVP